jgi:hypothetical protein
LFSGGGKLSFDSRKPKMSGGGKKFKLLIDKNKNIIYTQIGVINIKKNGCVQNL